jgi:nitroreductase
VKPELSVDQALTTTRAVRRRLDFDRPVSRGELERCVEIALQAPNGGNQQGWRWILISDARTKTAIAEYYRRFYVLYRLHRQSADPGLWERIGDTADAYAANLERAPWFVIPCIEGPLGRAGDGSSTFVHANTWASIYPAVWSFMLALRERGLATCLTTNHLAYEREVAELLGVPFDTVNQACLLPVAYAQGTVFRSAARAPLESVVHLERWRGDEISARSRASRSRW